MNEAQNGNKTLICSLMDRKGCLPHKSEKRFAEFQWHFVELWGSRSSTNTWVNFIVYFNGLSPTIPRGMVLCEMPISGEKINDTPARFMREMSPF